jgi:antitoxin component YwqK of YwqJK toxin-antitoxin module
MRSFLFILLISTLPANSQNTTAYYDYLWKPCEAGKARFVSNVIKTDSGWFRNDYYVSPVSLQMSGLYEDSANNIENGYFHYYYANGMPDRAGRSVHNKKEGLWLSFYSNGSLQDSTVYHDGHPVGTSMEWHFNGYAQDSTAFSNDGSAIEISWCSNGSPSAAGHLRNGKMAGPWQFFHNNGALAARENYDDTGRLVSASYYNKDGIQQDSATYRKYAEFPGGQKGWQKFIHKNIYFPAQYHIVNAESVTVVVAALIDEDGNIQEPYVKVPFNKAFDNIALAIFKKCPKWLPAMEHNHAVVTGILQPITFSQEE